MGNSPQSVASSPPYHTTIIMPVLNSKERSKRLTTNLVILGLTQPSDCVLPRKYRHFSQLQLDLFREQQSLIIPEQQPPHVETDLFPDLSLAFSKRECANGDIHSKVRFVADRLTSSELSRSDSDPSDATFHSCSSETPTKPQDSPQRDDDEEPPRKIRKKLNYRVAMKLYNIKRIHEEAKKKYLESLENKDEEEIKHSEQETRQPREEASEETEQAEEACVDLSLRRFPSSGGSENVEKSSPTEPVELPDDLFEDDLFDGNSNGEAYDNIDETSSSDDSSEEDSEAEEDLPEPIAAIRRHQQTYVHSNYDLNRLNILAKNVQKPEVFRRLPTKTRFSDDESDEEIVFSIDFEKEEAPSDVASCPGNCSIVSQPLLKPQQKMYGIRKPVVTEDLELKMPNSQLELEIERLFIATDFEDQCYSDEDYYIEIDSLITRFCGLFRAAGRCINEAVARWFVQINDIYHGIRVDIEENTKLVNGLINVLECKYAEDEKLVVDVKQLESLVAKYLELEQKVKTIRQVGIVERFVDRHSFSLNIQQRLEKLFQKFCRVHMEQLEIQDEEEATFLLHKHVYDEACLLQDSMKEEDFLAAFEEYRLELERSSRYFGDLLLLFLEAHEWRNQQVAELSQ